MIALLSVVFQAFGQVSSAQSSRKNGAELTLAWVSITALFVISITYFTVRPDSPANLPAGIIGGVFGLVGLYALFGAFRKTGTAVASAVVAASSSLVVSVASVLEGSPLGPTKLVGLGLGLCALALFTQLTKGESLSLGVPLAALAGTLFGFYVLMLNGISESQSDLATLLVARVVIALPICAVVLAKSRSTRVVTSIPLAAVVAGAFDSMGNLFLLLALRFDNLLVIGALSAVVPVIAGVTAALVLREKLSRRQLVALLVAVTGAGLLSV